MLFSVPILNEKILKSIRPAYAVLDIGCGIRPQGLIVPKIHICCDPFLDYLGKLQEETRDDNSREWYFVNRTWEAVLEDWDKNLGIFLAKVDTVFLIDVIEHLSKSEGLRLLKLTERIVNKQIIVYTPFGYKPQNSQDGKDNWGMNGGFWQTHHSGWLPEDFPDDWRLELCNGASIFAIKDCHV